jgi:hypothetical protein
MTSRTGFTPVNGNATRAAALLLFGLFATAAPPPAAAFQTPAEAAVRTPPATDTNFIFPVDYIEQRLRAPLGEILGMERTRVLAEDRSRRVTLVGADGEAPMEAHWKPVASPGSGFNNEPRYELAAYHLQKMFLDEPDYVVAPAVLRAMPIEEYRQYSPARGPTIRGASSVLFLLSYWIQNLTVDTVDPLVPELFERDTTYARHFANANLLTHLIDHKDGNHGNVVVSMDAMNRRVFALDNDVAFRSQPSDRGDRWRRLHVNRLPESSVERLRAITREDLERELAVVAEFAIVDGQLEPVEPGPNLGDGRGVRIRDGRVQFGLTRGEIGDLERRIANLLRDVDRGRLTVF